MKDLETKHSDKIRDIEQKFENNKATIFKKHNDEISALQGLLDTEKKDSKAKQEEAMSKIADLEKVITDGNNEMIRLNAEIVQLNQTLKETKENAKAKEQNMAD